jgi:autophagy-related protein 16
LFTFSCVNDICLTDDEGYVYIFVSHKSSVNHSCDRIISGHVDNSVRFWDAKTGDCVKEITGIHAGQITSVSVSPGKPAKYLMV